MSRYSIKFKKEGYLKYTSHLDIMRFFQRTFKRADIKLLYSQGFNPHPKMSIAQPLSLGYTSTGDYIEIETESEMNPDNIYEVLNKLMPLGIEIICVKAINQGKKTLAALVEFGEYEIKLGDEYKNLGPLIEPFMKQDKIQVKKLQRKTGIESILDIKPLIHDLTSEDFEGHIKLTMVIRNGSQANLNPELLLQALLDYSNCKKNYSGIEVNRKELYYTQDGKLIKFEDYNC